MLLVIDAGNTNVVIAVFDGEKLIARWRLSTDQKRTFDEYSAILSLLFKNDNISFSDIKSVVISNVVPQTAYTFDQLSKIYFNCDPFVVGDKKLKLGLNILIDNPKEVGSDRLVNAIAAHKKFASDCIIIDFGTATNFDVVNAKGDYIGGVLAPGVNLSLESLYKAAAKLPQVSIRKPENIIGKSTITAMQSGIYWGYIAMIEGLIEKIKVEFSPCAKVIATGGLASLFSDGTKKIEIVEPDLTIYGIKYVHDMNI